MELVVLNCWVTETKAMPQASKASTAGRRFVADDGSEIDQRLDRSIGNGGEHRGHAEISTGDDLSRAGHGTASRIRRH